jgi:formylglycine-generating enzyme required for sulfatase activity
MQSWFLSYHSPDQALAERLKAAIERKDSTSRVFFAPTHMRAGGSWSAQLAQEIADATAFILLIGKEVGPWQVLEYDEALDKWAKSPTGFPLIVILLEGQTAPGLPFLRRLHWIITPNPSSEKEIGRLFDAASGDGSSRSDLWRYTSPYRGLVAMEEKDSDYFFGRKRETVGVLSALAGAPDRLPLLIGNSGVGKSSLAQAGVLAALKRQAWPEEARTPNAWPAAFDDSRQWCFLTLKPGTDPLKALVESFLDTWQFAATDPERVTRHHGWMEAFHGGKATLPDLIDATERRRKELDQPKPPGFFLYVDQGEELYVRAEEGQRRRFSELLAQALPDPRLHIMMSMRSDFLGHLQNDKPLFKVRQHIDVPPLDEQELREIISRPAELLSARFETDGLVDIISRRTAEDAVKDVGALPLLSYTLDDMWTQMVRRGDGTLRLPIQSFELGGVLVDRANRFLETHPGGEDALRRVLTLRLATVREDGEPTRRRAARAEFSDQEWRLVSELANYPNRLLVTVTTETGEIFAEVAHEAVFRRWQKLRDWIATEREFLAWRTGLEAARRAWQAAPGSSKTDALLMGAALTQAQSWLAKRREDLSAVDRDFIDQGAQRERKVRARARRVQALVYVLLVGIILGLIGVINEAYVKEEVNWYWTMRPYRVANIDPYVLKPEAERALKPGDWFRECAKDCPEMVVVPAGEFMMGSPRGETGRYANEDPQHRVTIAGPFAVSTFELTFADWDACVSVGGCPQEGRAGDGGWGRSTQPVIYVSWDDAQAYVAWLSRMTGKAYRLLTEAEWEYAARAGKTTAYSWGDEIGKNNASCSGCGSQWDARQTAPVGSFAANAFGLHDMHGNVWEWVEDCYHDNYDGAPTDGLAWTSGDCKTRVVRGGSWSGDPRSLRAADRLRITSDLRSNSLGFRVGRTLFAGAGAITVAPGAH